MSKLIFNPSNKKYYSEDFIKGFECGVERQFNADMEEKTEGDLISRQAVIDLLNKLIEVEQKQGTDVMNYGRERVNAYESILDEIESDYLFPSIPSAENTAEWKKDNEDYFCSNCGYKYSALDEDGCPIPDKYCPNCGAKMEESGEE